jgi:hypothetical protein
MLNQLELGTISPLLILLKLLKARTTTYERILKEINPNMEE